MKFVFRWHKRNLPLNERCIPLWVNVRGTLWRNDWNEVSRVGWRWSYESKLFVAQRFIVETGYTNFFVAGKNHRMGPSRYLQLKKKIIGTNTNLVHAVIRFLKTVTQDKCLHLIGQTKYVCIRRALCANLHINKHFLEATRFPRINFFTVLCLPCFYCS